MKPVGAMYPMFTAFTGFGLPTLGLWTSGIRGALGSLAESDTMNDHEGGPADE